MLRRRRRARLDRLHRGPAGEQERLAQPLDQQGHAPGVHRPQQPRDRPLLARGAREHRHPHLPRRRLRLGALQGGALREAAEQDVPAQRGLLPHPVRQRGGQGGGLPARAAQYRRDDANGVAAGLLHGRHQPARPRGRDARAGRERPRHGGQVHPGRSASAPPTTAASRRSAATSSPSTARRTSRATSRCRRSRRAWRARGWRPRSSGSSAAISAASRRSASGSRPSPRPWRRRRSRRRCRGRAWPSGSRRRCRRRTR